MMPAQLIAEKRSLLDLLMKRRQIKLNAGKIIE